MLSLSDLTLDHVSSWMLCESVSFLSCAIGSSETVFLPTRPITFFGEKTWLLNEKILLSREVGFVGDRGEREREREV